ncbi:MAG: ABC transporter ATP-binding protein [Clostridiales Family XIII bacterium]|nr:ABC transporter ATP-binding protein [Clostridiales Family XIII bacterium]
MRDGRVVRKAAVKSVDGVSLTLFDGEILGVIGESGCGKSTLGRLIVRLESPSDGKVLYRGTEAETLYKKDKLAFRRTTQMVFQNPFETFDPRYTIGKTLIHTLRLHRIGADDAERISLISAQLEQAGLTPAKRMLARYPHEMSGGQLQRVSIIRSLMLGPEVIVADEPVSMLDISMRADIINLLYASARRERVGLIFISHDISLTRYISDFIAVMYLGNIVEYGKASEVVGRPMHPYTKVLVSNSPSADPLETRQPIMIIGEPATPIDVPEGCVFSPRCPEAVPECAFEKQELRGIDHRLIRCSRV